MKRMMLLLSAVAFSGLTAIAAQGQSQSTGTQAEDLTVLGYPVTDEQITLGRQVYAQNCASCHGAELQGQPNWRRRLENGRMPAPPHDESGHTWHHSDQDLFDITKLGVGGVVAGYESDMPAFEDILSDEEIAAVLAFIKSTWPERQRESQARVTAKAGGGA
ncbi:MAG: cytochrome C [Hoeflea sp.]|jgi:mono/diheme cytochrome c family protein|uniref:c-type cytochrome n=1 Tax=Hoeflea sp. TaxID=1940281 RepID=UPI000C0D0DA6|nr:cytochrome c [Hoeflea sp.]PHR20366.1 MAG: cytochrome C [Hoeflea sp.]